MTAAPPPCLNGCDRPARHLAGKYAGLCKPCRDRAQRTAAKIAGKCARCQVRPTEQGYTQCPSCRAVSTAYAATSNAANTASGADAASKRRNRAARKAAGLCQSAAGHGPAVAGNTYCRPCLDRRNARNVRRAERFWSAHGIDAWTCWICCGPIAPGDRHIEHVVPRARGGSDEPSNLRPSDSRCNLAKSDDDPWPYLASVWDDIDPTEVNYL